MLKNLRQNNRGIVFITVLMIIIVMMILAISIINLNVSQVMITENEVKRIQADILAQGALAFTFANQLSQSPSDSISYPVTLDNTTFTILTNLSAPGAGPLGTQVLNVYISY